VTVTATDERIDVLAKEKVVLQAGQTEIVLEGGDITFKCPGTFTVKAGQVPFRGADTNPMIPPHLPHQSTVSPERFVIRVQQQFSRGSLDGKSYRLELGRQVTEGT